MPKDRLADLRKVFTVVTKGLDSGLKTGPAQ